MTIRVVEAELILADGQTDMTKLIVAFPNLANVSNNERRKRHGCASEPMGDGNIVRGWG